jgi:hypothetical protein
MAAIMPTSPLRAEVAMDLDKRFAYELRIAELESQIQALLSWKKTVLATLSTAMLPASPTITRRKTADVVFPQLKSSISKIQTNRDDEFFRREKFSTPTIGMEYPQQNPSHSSLYLLIFKAQRKSL